MILFPFILSSTPTNHVSLVYHVDIDNNTKHPEQPRVSGPLGSCRLGIMAFFRWPILQLLHRQVGGHLGMMREVVAKLQISTLRRPQKCMPQRLRNAPNALRLWDVLLWTSCITCDAAVRFVDALATFDFAFSNTYDILWLICIQ